MSRILSPCQHFPVGPWARAGVVLVVGVACLILAAPAAAHHRDRPHRPEVRDVDVRTYAAEVTYSRVRGAVAYRFYQNRQTVRWSTRRTASYYGLRCDRSYSLGVRAYDRQGDRSRLRSVSVHTDPCPPRNTALPAVQGTPAVGETLTATTGSWSGSEPLSFSYQWLRCGTWGYSCSPIPGATASTRVLDAADAGRTLRVRVDARNRGGTRSATSAAVGPVTDDTTSPDPPPPPDDDPPPPPDDPAPDPTGGCSVADTSGCVPGTTLTLTDDKFYCDRPLSHYGTLPLKVVVNFTPGRLFGGNGAIDLYTGCAGDGNPSTVDLIVDVEGDGRTYGPGADAFKVRHAAGYNGGIQVTGSVDCGPKYTLDGHQDGVQLQGGRDITFVDFHVGDYAAGRATCQGAGGAFFYSSANGYTPANVDVVRGSYIGCNHSLLGAYGSGDVTDAKFRSGRTDGTDPVCTGYAASDPCMGGSGGVTLSRLTCQSWNRTYDRWE